MPEQGEEGFPPQGDSFRDRFPTSEALFQRARAVLAGLATHDSRVLAPFPLFVDRAEGAWKWDPAGLPLVDYWMGHGALLFGHGFPPVVEAVVRQARRGTHYGGAHLAEVEWARMICELVPSAERVRFTSSGTESTMLAIRVARAFTGRPKILKLDGHFHGWHDEALAHFVPPDVAGLSPGVVSSVLLAGPAEVGPVAARLERGDVAGVILEPGGGGGGALPWSADFLRSLRDATSMSGALLIFDEVVSGFRYAPGGVQELSGVLPDLTALAKIMSGGLPGGAVAGRAEVMEVFGEGTRIGQRSARVPHSGTFNANPLSAAAGMAMLEHVKDGAAQKKAEAAATGLASVVNEVAEARSVDVSMFASSSIFHLVIGGRKQEVAPKPSPEVVLLYMAHPSRYATLRRALLTEGIDAHAFHGWVSTAHDAQALQFATDAFDRAFSRVQGEPGFGL